MKSSKEICTVSQATINFIIRYILFSIPLLGISFGLVYAFFRPSINEFIFEVVVKFIIPLISFLLTMYTMSRKFIISKEDVCKIIKNINIVFIIVIILSSILCFNSISQRQWIFTFYGSNINKFAEYSENIESHSGITTKTEAIEILNNAKKNNRQDVINLSITIACNIVLIVLQRQWFMKLAKAN